MAEASTPGGSTHCGSAPRSTRCGYVALLGAPNAGKSTLVNRLVGAKVSIVTPKAQTTRGRILAIALIGDAQVVLVDTPGIFTPKKRLQRAMVAAAWGAAPDADLLLVLVDAKKGIDDNVETILSGLKKDQRRALLVLNKIDLVPRQKLLALAETLNRSGVFGQTFMISALDGDGVDDLAQAVAAQLPAGPWLFPEDQLTDLPQRLMAAEITREQVFLQLHQELPYAIAVETESWRQQDDGAARIEQVIHVQRQSQKGIVVGKAGTRIKSIGAAARAGMEDLFGRRVHLFLRVKLRHNWADDPGFYKSFGLDFDA